MKIKENIEQDIEMPEINVNNIKKLTMKKIRDDNVLKARDFKIRFFKVASFVAMILFITVSTYAYNNGAFYNFINKLTGVEETQILMVGESVSNRDYKLKVHEMVTDSYVGEVIISIETISDKSKKDFDSYKISLNHIGSGYGLRNLEQYDTSNEKFYQISFSGATYKDSHNKGLLEFSIHEIKKVIKVSLTPTVQVIDVDIAGDDSNDYRFKFDKIHLSEIGVTLEGVDKRKDDYKLWYKIELLFKDGSKALVEKELGDEYLKEDENKLSDGSSFRTNGDLDYYVTASLSFIRSIPLDTIEQVIINDIAYDIEY